MSKIKIPDSLEDLILDLKRFPSVGKKTATRYAYWLISQDQEYLTALAKKVHYIKKLIKVCKICGNKTKADICEICMDKSRENGVLCIVEQAEDILQIEKTEVFKGKYHVLGGIIDPLNKTNFEDLSFDKLSLRINNENIQELIIALGNTVQGDVTTLAIRDLFRDRDLKISILGRGLSTGAMIEYIDTDTLREAFQNKR